MAYHKTNTVREENVLLQWFSNVAHDLCISLDICIFRLDLTSLDDNGIESSDLLGTYVFIISYHCNR